MSNQPMREPQPMRLLGQIYRSFVKRVDAPLRELGLAVSQLPVLVSLRREGPLSQVELARLAQVEQPSMAQLLGRMERDGLVERIPDPVDGRSRKVSLTDAAQAVLPDARAVMEEASAVALAGFSPQERAQLLDALLRIEANLAGQATEAS